MDDNYKKLAKLFDNTPRICEKCNGAYEYMGAGEYKCKNCGNIAYDDYGKVRKFIEEHGPAPYHVVKNATGVNGKLVREYLDTPNGERDIELKCKSCGRYIPSGTLCSACAGEGVHTPAVSDKKIQPSKPSTPPADNKSGIHFVVDRNK